MTRRQHVLLGVLVVAATANVVLLLSGAAGTWWRDLRFATGWRLPSSLRGAWFELSGLKNADVHVVMWAVTTALLAALVQKTSHVLMGMGAALAVSVVIEVLQGPVASRSFQWRDVVGNLIGVVLGGGAVLLARWFRQRALRLAGE